MNLAFHRAGQVQDCSRWICRIVYHQNSSGSLCSLVYLLSLSETKKKICASWWEQLCVVRTVFRFVTSFRGQDFLQCAYQGQMGTYTVADCFGGKKTSDKPTVHFLHSTKRHTDKASNNLVKKMIDLAAKKTDISIRSWCRSDQS